MIDKTRPLPASKTTAFPIIFTAFFSWPLPIARLNADEPPIPINKASARHEVDNGNAMLVAAFPNSPTLCPIKN
jgi:hypothetical protein